MVTDTHGWSDKVGIKVAASGSVGIPVVTDFKVTVEGSAEWAQNGSSSTTRTFAWQQPLLVPAFSKVVATVAITKSTLLVPYTMPGTYRYSSGAAEPGAVRGTYSGISSHNLEVKLKQYNLDGSPAAVPVQQPAATLLQTG